jgi:hypothetical protein
MLSAPGLTLTGELTRETERHVIDSVGTQNEQRAFRAAFHSARSTVASSEEFGLSPSRACGLHDGLRCNM